MLLQEVEVVVVVEVQVEVVMLLLRLRLTLAQECSKPVILASHFNTLLSKQMEALGLPSVS